MGPYAYKGNQWVSYDDKNMLRKKSQLVRSLGLGGGMVWALDLDDFKNRCDEGYHPLLSEIQRVLRDPPRDVEPDRMFSTATRNVAWLNPLIKSNRFECFSFGRGHF